MSMKVTIFDVLKRAETGTICKSEDWCKKVIPGKINEKLKKHGLEKTCTPENPINMDDSLADKFWEAGLELAIDTGFLCETTRRVIKFTEEEIKDYIRGAPAEITLGGGRDRITIRARAPEDKNPFNGAWMGPMGVEISEDLWIPIHQSHAQYRIVDGMAAGVLQTAYGIEVKTGTPSETLAGMLEAVLTKEALRRAGRPGMSCECVVTSPSAYGHLGGFGIPGGYDSKTDLPFGLALSPSRTDYSTLQKAVHAFNCRTTFHSGGFAMIGGYCGSPEGATAAAISQTILQMLVHQTETVGGLILDARYFGACGREAVWADSVLGQAVSRNTHLLRAGLGSSVSGPGTDSLLYELAVIGIGSMVSGASFMFGPRAAGGKYPEHTTGLESKFFAEVCKASVGLKRSDGNEIVKKLIPKFEESLAYPPKGKTFRELCDIKTLKPNKEWQEIYDKVKEELIDLGLPLSSLKY